MTLSIRVIDSITITSSSAETILRRVEYIERREVGIEGEKREGEDTDEESLMVIVAVPRERYNAYDHTV